MRGKEMVSFILSILLIHMGNVCMHPAVRCFIIWTKHLLTECASSDAQRSPRTELISPLFHLKFDS